MKMMARFGKGIGALIFGILIGFLAGGCGTTGGGDSGPPPPPAPTAPGTAQPTSIDSVRIGDKIEVAFSDIPEAYPVITQRVREDGSITLPLGVRIVAAGKKSGELQDLIRAEYVPKFFNRLTVSVKLEERVIYVGGYVRRPDRYVFAGEMTVLSAIKVAGDFNEFAKRTAVVVTRADGTRITVNCKKALKDSRYDVPVFPGDSINVERKVF